MIPRLTLDIGWRDLAYAMWASNGRGAGRRATAAIKRRASAGRAPVVALSVRSAFDALLSELALPPGSEVLASAVTIQNMADIVAAHGLVLKPVDIDLATLAPTPEALEAAVGPQSRLFLLAHLYGVRAETMELAEVCHRHGLLFVEDCAQAFDGVLDAAPGTDVSLFSFGPIKAATALGGAVGLFADQSLGQPVEARLGAYHAMPVEWYLRRVTKHALLKLASAPALYSLVFKALRDPEAAIGSAARGFKPGDLLAQVRRAPPPILLSLLARRLANPPPRRRHLAQALARHLPAGAVPGSEAPRHGWWLFPVLVSDPAAAIAALRELGLDATQGATSLRAFGPAPNAERLIGQVVYVPLAGDRLAETASALSPYIFTEDHAPELAAA